MWIKAKKIVSIFILIITLFSVFSNTVNTSYSAINTDYYEENINATKVKETETSLDKKVKSSILLDAIGNLVYVIGSVMEFLIGKLFSAVASGFSGNELFPWADMIVFNAVPLLDVNFINPDPNSAVVGFQEVIKNIYGTIFGLAISFFSIAILIMGVKLAISTIASEKAKYKQAIWDWLLGLILLFTIHIFISFVFYLNEQLVIKASVIATEALDNAQIVIEAANDVSAEDMCYNFISAMRQPSIAKTVLTGLGIAATVVAIIVTAGGAAIPTALAVAISAAGAAAITTTLTEVAEAVEANLMNDPVKTEQIIMENVDIASYLLQDEDYVKLRLGSNLWSGDDSSWWAEWSGTRDATAVVRLAANVALLTDDTIASGNTKSNKELYMETIEKYIDSYKTSNAEYRSQNADTYKIHIALRDAYELYESGENVATHQSLISNLAQYFKTTSWSYGNNSWKASKVVIQNAIMYAVFVVQSLIFLIAYAKRLFYVILLAIMSPVVVVYDFFNKSIS